MPAAAVIPAPIAYIKVVAVKKLVVGFLEQSLLACLFTGYALASPVHLFGEQHSSSLGLRCDLNRLL